MNEWKVDAGEEKESLGLMIPNSKLEFVKSEENVQKPNAKPHLKLSDLFLVASKLFIE